MMSRKQKMIFGLLAAIVLIVAFFFSGFIFPWAPLPSRTNVVRDVEQAPDLDKYVADVESQVPGIKPDLKRGIIWADPAKHERTKLSFIYIHGFTASRGETAPLLDHVARDLHANLYYTRLKAHGLNDGGESFATVTADDWMDDAREALAIGRRLGERVVVVGMSTGAPLAIQLAVENHSSPDIAALVLISANFAPADGRARLLSGPLGPYIARILAGKYHSFTPSNEAHGYFWTPRSRSEGIVPVMDLVNYIARLDLSQIKTPVLSLYTHNDKVVNVGLIKSRHEDFGSSVKSLVDLPEATRHEFASAALAPEVVDPAAKVIEDFVGKL